LLYKQMNTEDADV